jgi:hypothetical protein
MVDNIFFHGSFSPTEYKSLGGDGGICRERFFVVMLSLMNEHDKFISAGVVVLLHFVKLSDGQTDGRTPVSQMCYGFR